MPENRWPCTAPPEDLQGEGWDLGQVIPELRLPDQHGEEVSLWQWWDRVVLLSVGAMWCAPCRELAGEAEQLALRYGDQGFVHVTVLLEDGSGLPVSVDDAAAFAAALGVHGPVLADPDGLAGEAVTGSFPRLLLLDRSLSVAAAPDGADSLQALASLIESEL
jgi:thiol-disulfide isomerase/thioredoxin